MKCSNENEPNTTMITTCNNVDESQDIKLSKGNQT